MVVEMTSSLVIYMKPTEEIAKLKIVKKLSRTIRYD